MKKIGIPRALLYYRYSVLWINYFNNLGHEILLSKLTDRSILEIGERLSVDENCLSAKLFFGHVSQLIGKCDCIFVPRISNYGHGKYMCARFDALYDICVNVFRKENVSFLSCNVDESHGCSEDNAYIQLGIQLGADKKQAEEAYKKAVIAYNEDIDIQIKEQEALIESDKIKLLVVGHSYNILDEYIGMPVVKGIKNLDAVPIMADIIKSDDVYSYSEKNFKNVPWLTSVAFLENIEKYHCKIDGIVLLSTFPCGPDSVVNEMIIRKIKDIPILNLLIDTQSGNAGIETRLESFIDIIRFRKVGSYYE